MWTHVHETWKIDNLLTLAFTQDFTKKLKSSWYQQSYITRTLNDNSMVWTFEYFENLEINVGSQDFKNRTIGYILQKL